MGLEKAPPDVEAILNKYYADLEAKEDKVIIDHAEYQQQYQQVPPPGPIDWQEAEKRDPEFWDTAFHFLLVILANSMVSGDAIYMAISRMEKEWQIHGFVEHCMQAFNSKRPKFIRDFMG